MASVSDPRLLLGLSPTAEPLLDYLKQLADLTSNPGQTVSPEIKSYSDALYMNYYPLGLSLMFIAKESSSIKNIDPQSENLVLDSIDIYNVEPAEAEAKAKPKGASTTQTYTSHPVPSLKISLLPSAEEGKERPTEIILTASSAGKEIVGVMGEPDRKGGGSGPSSGSIGIWCEWARDGIMIEFGGSDARGPQAWERGKDAKWKILTLFRPKEA